MTVLIAHAPQDAPAAEALEKFLERRGLFAERETGERGFRFAQARDAVVVLWSRDTVFSTYRMLIEKRALDAWADEQLILIRLDNHVLPVGLRDLSAIDAAFEPQRDIAWAAVTKAAQDIQMGRTAAKVGAAPAAPAPKRAQAPAAKPVAVAPAEEPSWLWAAAALVAIPVGTFASVAVGLRDPAWPILGAGLAVAAVWWASKQSWGRSQSGASGPPGMDSLDPPILQREASAETAPEAAAEPVANATFVSYAHADGGAVLPVVDQLTAAGKPIWIDRAGIQAGDGWAGEIVRAIKAARGVVVMCSAKAFESDHVRRELYLADRYKKPMLPVFLEDAKPPEDFEYFFAGVQWLKLFETPEAERAATLTTALKL